MDRRGEQRRHRWALLGTTAHYGSVYVKDQLAYIDPMRGESRPWTLEPAGDGEQFFIRNPGTDDYWQTSGTDFSQIAVSPDNEGTSRLAITFSPTSNQS
ncbi:hypothetical protein [Saccharopolyspora hattusasensis]|uniref:hypothetical protein n=1 Tax=Saccharopolyspora hattusasensis TaxID=1128679 RepID=UPI003D95747C